MARNWVFTINNYEDELEPFNWLPEDSFCIWQAEVGESGTPHLQGYIELGSVQRLSYLKKLHSTAHWEKRKGSQEQAIAYSSKEDTRVSGPWIYGDKKVQGQRSDLESIRYMMLNDCHLDDIKDANFSCYIRHKRAIDHEYKVIQYEKAKMRRLAMYDSVQWRPWQQDVIELIQTDPDPRRVHWFYEESGNTGKSYLSRYLISKYSGFLCTGGKVVDIQYAYEGQRIVILDLSRTKAEHIDHLYEMIELWKDGSFLSTKYESQTKHFGTPHVLVFSNFRPSTEKLSEDRWDIRYIRNGMFECERVHINAKHDFVKFAMSKRNKK